MSERIKSALDELHRAVVADCDDSCVSVEVFINCEGVSYKEKQRTPVGFSMQNLRGEWVRRLRSDLAETK